MLNKIHMVGHRGRGIYCFLFFQAFVLIQIWCKVGLEYFFGFVLIEFYYGLLFPQGFVYLGVVFDKVW